MKGGDAGKSKVIFKAKNKNNTMPTGIAAALAAGVPAGSAATIQFIPSGEPGGLPAGTVCLEMELADIKKNDGIIFKAEEVDSSTIPQGSKPRRRKVPGLRSFGDNTMVQSRRSKG